LQNAHTRSPRHAKQLQDRHLHALCTHILPHVPFYSELFRGYGIDPARITSLERWRSEGLPLIKKAEYLKRPKDFIVTPDKAKLFRTHANYLFCARKFAELAALFTSRDKRKILKDHYGPKMLIFSGGTETDNPAPVILTANQKFNSLHDTLLRTAELALPKLDLPSKTGINLFPYAPHLGWHAVHHGLDLIADLNLCTAAGGAMRTERLAQLASKTQPTILCGMHDYFRNRFLPHLIQKKIKLPEKVLIITGAQKMLDSERAQVEALARKAGARHVTVLDLFAASELKTALLPECTPHSGYHHVSPLSAIIQPVHFEPGKTNFIEEYTFEDSGALASWTLEPGGSELCGYLLGDMTERTTHGRCTHCGFTGQTFFHISRARDIETNLALTGIVEEKLKGAKINLQAYRERALSVPLVREVQIVLHRAKRYLEIKYVSDKPALARAKLEKLFTASEIRPKLTATTLDKLQGGKIKFEGIVIL